MTFWALSTVQVSLGDLWRCRPGLGEKRRRGATAVMKIKLVGADCVCVLAPALVTKVLLATGANLGIAMLVGLSLISAGQADAASSAGCEGGGFIVMGRTMPQGANTIPANSIASWLASPGLQAPT